MSFSQFTILPLELQEEILKKCTPNEQLDFARTSKRSHNLIIPLLYRNLDFSVHNRPGLFRGQYCTLVHADNPLMDEDTMREECVHKQQLFFNVLRLHPDYGGHVVRLSWTHFSSLDWESRQVSEVPTWNAFRLLPNVKYLDFASLAIQRECVAPPLLFPRVTHLRILGQMSFAFVRAFTDSLDPAQLILLEFDNLQDFGQLREGEDLEILTDLAMLPESNDSEGNSIIRHPGSMRGHLRRLEGKCPSMKYLYLRSVGNDWTMDRQWSSAIDAARYKEWASFIDSVRPTLEVLVIEHGLEVESANILHCRPAPVQVGRPMDERFLEYILPILIQGEWPCLKQMKILGVGSRPKNLVGGFFPEDMAIALYVKMKLLASYWKFRKQQPKPSSMASPALTQTDALPVLPVTVDPTAPTAWLGCGAGNANPYSPERFYQFGSGFSRSDSLYAIDTFCTEQVAAQLLIGPKGETVSGMPNLAIPTFTKTYSTPGGSGKIMLAIDSDINNLNTVGQTCPDAWSFSFTQYAQWRQFFGQTIDYCDTDKTLDNSDTTWYDYLKDFIFLAKNQ
ncbi:hypothetical protein EG329_013747 [Mollisiaceae sp. DMI_Dod_QoI]|nr:hypothetical protein EG329_013747 [Helotiales sp. DMI_Dod_QoI]